MLQEMTGEEVLDWWNYYQVEPWGAQRDDGRSIHHVNMIAGLLGEDTNSQLAIPTFISEIYCSAPMSDDMMAKLEQIRGNRSNHRDQPGS